MTFLCWVAEAVDCAGTAGDVCGGFGLGRLLRLERFRRLGPLGDHGRRFRDRRFLLRVRRRQGNRRIDRRRRRDGRDRNPGFGGRRRGHGGRSRRQSRDTESQGAIFNSLVEVHELLGFAVRDLALKLEEVRRHPIAARDDVVGEILEIIEGALGPFLILQTFEVLAVEVLRLLAVARRTKAERVILPELELFLDFAPATPAAPAPAAAEAAAAAAGAADAAAASDAAAPGGDAADETGVRVCASAERDGAVVRLELLEHFCATSPLTAEGTWTGGARAKVGLPASLPPSASLSPSFSDSLSPSSDSFLSGVNWPPGVRPEMAFNEFSLRVKARPCSVEPRFSVR